MSDYMPEPPPIDYDDWLPPPPDEPYFMPDDPFPDDLFSGAPPPDYDYVPVDDPWLPDDARFMPEDVGHLPDVPPLSQDGLQGFEPPEPADEGWGWHDARLIGVEREADDGTRYEIGAIDVYANVNTGDLGGVTCPPPRLKMWTWQPPSTTPFRSRCTTRDCPRIRCRSSRKPALRR